MLDVFTKGSARRVPGRLQRDVGGAKAIVFGGGIGEHAAYVRERILSGMEWCGVEVDPERNEANAERISTDGSTRAVYVVAVEEALLIARQTVECLS